MSWGDVQFDARPANKVVSSMQRALAPTKIVGRVLLVYVGVFVPVISFLMAWDDPPNAPAWRSGDLHAHLTFLLTARVGFVFYPLMAYSMVCFVLSLFWRERFAARFIVRLGVYGGVVLGLHYCVILNVAMIKASDWLQVGGSLPFVAMFAAVAGVIGMGTLQLASVSLAWFWRLIGTQAFVLSICAAVPALLFLAVVSQSPEVFSLFFAPLFIVFFVSLLCGPYWFTAAYLYLSVDLTRRYWAGGQFQLWQLMSVFTWLAGYLAACRVAVNMAMVEYNKLPTEPPGDCYIATAAARGHARVVGSRDVVLAGGKTMRVNRQLQILKCAEIAIRALCPRLHRALRCVYNRIGPVLARRIGHPIIADAAFVTLLPAQWTASVALRGLLHDIEAQSSQLYCRADACHGALAAMGRKECRAELHSVLDAVQLRPTGPSTADDRKIIDRTIILH